MHFAKRLFVVIVVISAQTDALPDSLIPRCSTECAVSGLQKLFYVPSNIYTYTYTGKSEIIVNGIADAKVNLEWAVDVDLKWITPCEVIMELRNAVVMGAKDETMAQLLTKEPLVIIMSEGVVRGLCVSPDEDPINLNLKKGIVSALQNSLPSLSIIHSGKTYTEFDVVGMCPTYYTVDAEASKYIVTKFKNHLDCSQRVSDQSETLINLFVLRSPHPVRSSTSKCVQEIRDGIIFSVVCEDMNKIQATFTSSKFIEAHQHSRLMFKRKRILKFPSLELEKFWHTTLAFDEYPDLQSSVHTTQVYEILKKICRKTEHGIDKSVPRLTAQLVRFIEKIPAVDLLTAFENIKTKKICSNSMHLQTIFMDIISFVKQEGSLKIMVDQILDGDLTGMRTQLYIVSMFFKKNLSPMSMEILVPVFESPKAPSTLLLAAGSLMQKYCKYDSDCYDLPSVQKIFTILSDLVKTSCQNVHLNNSERHKVLAALKTIGNIGNMSQTLKNEVLNCIHAVNADHVVRVAGIESFRKLRCSKTFVDNLLNLMLRSNETTEIRISAYLQCIRCPSIENIRKIVESLQLEKDLNVASFVLSHIENVVNTYFPSAKRMKKLMSGVKLPNLPVTPFSQNLNTGYYVQSFKTGIDADRNIVTDEKDNLRKYDYKLQLAIFSNVYNLGEISLRDHNAQSSRFEEASQVVNLDNLAVIMKIMIFDLLSGHKDYVEHSSEGYEKRQANKSQSDLDGFLRLFGTEIMFLSLAREKSQTRQISKENFRNEFNKALKEFKDNFDIEDNNSIRACYAGFRVFVPTVQGIPLLLKLEATTLLGFNVLTNLTHSPEKNGTLGDDLIIRPTFSSEIQSLVGFSFGAKVGIRNRNNINLSPDIQVIVSKTGETQLKMTLETPKLAINILEFQSHVYLMKRLPEKEDMEIVPKSFASGRRLIHHSCMPERFNFYGSKMCWKFNLNDIFASDIFSFGYPSSFTFYIELENPQTKEFVLDSSWRVDNETRWLNLDLGTQGSKTQDKGEVELGFMHVNNYQSLQVYTSKKGESTSNGLKLTIEDKETKYGKRKCLSLFAAKSKKFFPENMVLFMTYGGSNENKDQKSNVKFEMKTMNKLLPILNADIKILADVHFRTERKDFQQNQRLRESLEKILRQLSNSSYYNLLRVPLKKSFGILFKESLKRPIIRETLFWYPIKLKLRKLEIELGSGDLQTKSYLRLVSSDRRASEYRFLTMLEAGKALGGTRVTGDIAFRGVLDKSTVLTATFTGKFGDFLQYQSRMDFSSNVHTTNFDWNIENMMKNSQIALMRFSKTSIHSKTVNILTEAEVVFFGYIPHYKVNGTIAELQTGTYQVSYSLKKEENQLLHVEGPILVYITPDEAQEEVKLAISGPKWGPYYFKTGYVVSKERFRAILELKKLENNVIYLQASMDHPHYNETYATYQMILPRVTEIQVQIQSLLYLMKTNFSLELLPNSFGQKLLQGHSLINYRKQKLQAKVIISANKILENKLIIDADYDLSLEKRFFHISGDLRVLTEKYNCILELDLGSLTENTLNHFIINITKPNNENFFLDVLHHNKVFKTNVGDVTDRITIVTFKDKTYRVESNFCYVFEQSSNGVQIAGQINITSPAVDGIVIKINLATKSVGQYEKHHLQVSAVGYHLKESKNTSRISMVTPFSTNAQRKLASEKDFKIKIEVLFPSKVLRNVIIQLEKNTTESNLNFQSFKNSEQLLNIRFGGLNDTEWLVQLFAPSSNMEITSQITSKDSSLTLYPNKEWSPSGKAVGGRYIKGSQYIFEDRATRTLLRGFKTLKFLPNQDDFLSHVAIPQTSMTGAFEVKWTNQSHFERILISLESIKLTKDSFKTEVILWSPSFKSKPRILVESSSSPSLKSLTISFQQEASVPPSVSISGSFSSPTNEQKNLYGFVKTTRRDLEFTASLNNKRDVLPDVSCGSTLNGTLRSSKHGMFDFALVFCIPMYVEGGACRKGEPFSYVAKLGSQRTFAVVGIDRRSFSNSAYQSRSGNEVLKKVVKASISLYTSTVLHLEAFYSVPQIMEFGKFFQEGLIESTSLTNEVINDVWEEVFIKILESSSGLMSSLNDTYVDITTKMKEIYESAKLEKWFPDFVKWGKDVNDFLIHHLNSFKNASKRLREAFVDSFKKVCNDILSIFNEIDHTIKFWIQYLINDVQKIDFLQKLENYENTTEMLMRYIRPSSLWKLMKEFWSFVRDHFNTEATIITQLLLRTQEVLGEEVKYIWDLFIVSNRPIKNFANSISEWIYSNESSLVSLLRAILDVSVSEDEGHIEAKFPLRKSVNSVKSALVDVGIPKHVTFDYFYGLLLNENFWHLLSLQKSKKD